MTSLVLAVPAGPGAAQAPACSADTGASWPSYGHDLSNTRWQSAETSVGPGDVAGLETAWTFSSIDGGGIGAFQSTPVIAGGCMFVASASVSTPTDQPLLGQYAIDYDQYAIGWLYAVDVATGDLAWRTILGPVANINFFGGVFAPSVANGRVHVLVGSKVPYAIALDQHTGEELWRTHLADPGSNGALASAVVVDGLVFAAVIGGDGSNARTPFFILDATTGEILKTTYFMSVQEWLGGYAGGGSWTTAAVDRTSKHLFIGTSNPYGSVEGDFNNSIAKIDIDRSRASFGEVVGNFVGTRDDDPERGGDVDFGASPNLFTTSGGRVVVGDLQKSGEYHAIDAATMEHIWTTPVSPAAAGGNSATAAYDGSALYVASNTGHLYSLDPSTGAVNWDSEFPDLYGHYQPVTVANGVVYTMNTHKQLLAFDSATGATLLTKDMASPAGGCVWSAGGGVTVADGTVYAVCDKGADGAGVVIAYRPAEA